MIRSSEAEVLEDVERILKWAYSDRFTSRGAQYGILTEADIALVLSRKRRSERRTLFLLLARSAAGRRRIKQNTIATRIGMSRVSAIHAIQGLTEAGVVVVKRGETKYRGKGNFASQCNSYDVVRKRPEHGMRCKSISLERLNRAFDEVYNETIQELQQRERRNQR